uniref:ATGSL07 (Glucan synthase-like 7) n=1 Tax=Arundo donax TaxID=35708 RepID=A0A0A9GGR8_ARUDO
MISCVIISIISCNRLAICVFTESFSSWSVFNKFSSLSNLALS